MRVRGARETDLASGPSLSAKAGGTGRWAGAEREQGACTEHGEGSWAAGHAGRGSERAVRASWRLAWRARVLVMGRVG